MAGYKIAALILTYNDTTYTYGLCERLINENLINYIIIVDNSDDKKYDENQTLFVSLNSKIHYLKTKNEGYASGNNLGIKYILQNLFVDYIWLINNDIIPQSNASAAMTTALKKSDDRAICGSVLYYYSNSKSVTTDSVIQCFGGGLYYPVIGKSKLYCKGWNLAKLISLKDKRVDFIIGASMMVPVSVINDIGFIPQEYFMYNEEMDWQKHAFRKGYRLIVAEDSHVIHMDGLSTKNKKQVYYYYINRAAVLFTRKYYPYFIPTVLMYRLFEILFLTPGIKNKFFGIKGVINGILFSKTRTQEG
jgi:GT2 family glycosyltransferase